MLLKRILVSHKITHENRTHEPMCVRVYVQECLLASFFDIAFIPFSRMDRNWSLNMQQASSINQKYKTTVVQNVCSVYLFICKLDTLIRNIRSTVHTYTHTHNQLILIEFECFQKVAAATTISSNSWTTQQLMLFSKKNPKD